MEPTILFKECRPYNPTSGKYYIFNNNDLAWDPFGYYSGLAVGGVHDHKLGHLFYQSFPMDVKTWDMSPPSLGEDPAVDQSYTN